MLKEQMTRILSLYSCRSGGRVYHVLIFQEGGQFHLDSAGDQSEETLHFDSLDDLVVFCMGHNLRVAGDEVQLHEAVACEATTSPLHIAGESPSRAGDQHSCKLGSPVVAVMPVPPLQALLRAHSKRRTVTCLPTSLPLCSGLNAR